MQEEADDTPQQSPLHHVDHSSAEALPTSSSSKKTDYLKNFYVFSALYAVVHASLDSVLAYSAAELGTGLGAYGGFMLYMTYTFSALLFAKLMLQYVEVKSCVLLGLMALFCYVLAFFLAILLPQYAWGIYLTGAAIGGIGAGILWTAQGSYYSINAQEYASLVLLEEEEIQRQAQLVLDRDESQHGLVNKAHGSNNKGKAASPRRKLSHSHPHQFLFKDQSFRSNDDFFSASTHNPASDLLAGNDSSAAPSTATSSSNLLSTQQQVIIRFAAIFACFYLGLETVFKLLATVVFYLQSQLLHLSSWTSIIFCLYTVLAMVALVGFQLFVMRLQESSASANGYTGLATGDGIDPESFLASSPKQRYSKDHQKSVFPRKSNKSITKRFVEYFRSLRPRNNETSTSTPIHNNITEDDRSNKEKTFCLCLHWTAADGGAGHDIEWYHHLLAVGQGVLFTPKLQLLIPYQFCFGLSAGFVDTYINGVIVKNFIGEGYIGVLTAIITLTAALIASPCAYLCEHFVHGRSVVIVVGILCFGLTASFLLLFSDPQLASWSIVIAYYVLQGFARGIWENTNKALVADYFSSTESKEVAFASVYFASGIAGALGFLFCQFLSKTTIGLTNLAMSAIAVVCFLRAQAMHRREEEHERLLHSVHDLTSSHHVLGGDDLDDDSSSVASNEEVVFRFR